jgi:four helix bundle protein
MNEEKENIIVQKSYAFALEIIKLYKFLIERKEFVLSKQLLRSGTSIGANVHEEVGSESKKDFIHKLGIAVKQARETSYWLNLLRDGQFISNEEFEKLNNSCNELVRILNSIILTIKERYLTNS